MSRWTVLEVHSVGEDWVGVEGTDKIDLEWVRRFFPKARFEEDADYSALGCWKCEVRGLGKKGGYAIGRAIYKYLGQTGWEPYANFGHLLYWRKLMTD